jgi:xylose isomerase
MHYATRLNSMKAQPQLFFADGQALNVPNLIERASRVKGLHSLSLNYPEHFKGATIAELGQYLNVSGLRLDSLNTRYSALEFGRGGFTHPEAKVRQTAIDLTLRAVDVCAELGGDQVIVWAGQDGFDYPFQVAYQQVWDWELAAFDAIAAHNSALKIGIEYKPSEPRKHSIIANMGEALLAVQSLNHTNLGVVMDYCHALMSREHPAKVLELALKHKKLWGVHLNDGYGQLDDGLMVASVSLMQTLEVITVLHKYNFAGTIYFDTFPINEDPVAECEANIRVTEALGRTAGRILDLGILEQANQDGFNAVRVLELLLEGASHA